MIGDKRPESEPVGVAGPPPMADSRWARSLWLEGVVEDLTPREQLSGSTPVMLRLWVAVSEVCGRRIT